MFPECHILQPILPQIGIMCNHRKEMAEERGCTEYSNRPCQHSLCHLLILQNPDLPHSTSAPVTLVIPRILLLLLRRFDEQLATAQSFRMFEQNFSLVLVKFTQNDNIVAIMLQLGLADVRM